MTSLRCPRCESTDLEPCSEMLYASDETVQATHECTQCKTRFRRTEADPWRPTLYVNLSPPPREV